MDLILWRHAEAEDGEPDLARALTPKGEKQARRVGRWLQKHVPERCRIVVSPAVRALQTADALERDYEIVEAVAPGAEPSAVLDAAAWPRAREPVLVVGHQPTLGSVAARLLIGDDRSLWMRKAGVWWIESDGDGVKLRCVIDVDFC